MNYQKEYATLVGLVDRSITILEENDLRDDVVCRARQLLLEALLAAEERYMEQPETVQ